MDLPELRSAPETRSGEKIERALKAAAAGQLLSDEALRETFALRPNARSVEIAHAAYMSIPSQVGGAFTVRGYYDFPAGTVALIDTERGPWNVICLSDAEDGRVQGALALPWPDGVTIREASEADRSALEAINRESPIQMGERSVVYDTPDIFAAERLMGTSAGYVVEAGGEPVAFSAVACFEVRVGDEIGLVSYIHRTRVAPAARRGGVRGGAQWATFMELPEGVRGGFGMMHRDNAAILRLYPPGLITPTEPERLSFDIAKQAAEAGPLGFRRATSEDAYRIVQLLNETHDGEQLFVPYTVATLTERLSRDPSLYSWEHFRVSERATIGVWSGAYRVQRTGPDGFSQQTRALVLDYGFEDGAEEECVALLRATCRELLELGDTELALFTSPQSPGYEALRPLAALVDRYALIGGGPLMSGLEAAPIYIDHIYF